MNRLLLYSLAIFSLCSALFILEPDQCFREGYQHGTSDHCDDGAWICTGVDHYCEGHNCLQAVVEECRQTDAPPLYKRRSPQRAVVSRAHLHRTNMASSTAFLGIQQRHLLKALIAAATTGGTAYALFPHEAQMKSAKNNSSNGSQKPAKCAVDPEVIKSIERAFEKLNGPEGAKCHSLLKKHLTKEVVEKLKCRKTKLGATLYDCISSGVHNLDAGVGVYAPDAESYKVFAELFDKIIEEYHGFSPKQKQPAVDLGEGKSKDFPALDPKGKYIKSTRIRCGRSLAGYPFNPLLKAEDYEAMEGKVKKALESVSDKELKGVYYPLTGMTKETQQKLIADHFLFKEGDRHLQHANACNFWPKGRGIFHNNDKTFLIWVNEEDHMRIISMQEGSDVGAVLDRLVRGIKAVESKVPFSRDDRLGWLTFCPTNLGSTVRASVHIKLPLVSARKDFKKICDSLNLQVRGIHGEHSESEGGVYDISNKARLGLSEYQAVKQMYDGVKHLIKLEEDMEKQK